MKTQLLIRIAFALLIGIASFWAIWYYEPGISISFLLGMVGGGGLQYCIKDFIKLSRLTD